MALVFPGSDTARQPALTSGFASFAGTALTYALTGWLGLQLALAPGFASPIYPAAGVALASVLTFGTRMVPAVALGSVLANLLFLVQHDRVSALGLGLACVFGMGAALQAILGAKFVRRVVRGPLILSEPSEVARFFAAALLSSFVSPSIGTLALDFAAAVPAPLLPLTAATWWLGDLFGLLVAAPLALSLMGRPRHGWMSRRLAVALPLLLAMGLVAASIAAVVRWNEARTSATFHAEASSASLAIAARMQEPLHALQALSAVLTVAAEPSRGDVHRAAKPWLDTAGVQLMGWSERVQYTDAGAYEARLRAEGTTYDRVAAEEPGSPAGRPEGRGGARPREAMVIRHIEPLSSNAAALGVDALAVPATRAAIAATRRSGVPVATAAFRVGGPSRSPEAETSGIVIYQAVFAGEPGSAAERQLATRGVAFVALDMDAQLRALAPQFSEHLRVCLVDHDRSAPRRRLAGMPSCEAEPGGMLDHTRTLAFAGREWDLRVYAREADVAPAFNGNAWLLSIIGLIAVTMLAACLLTVTGRRRRIEIAVRDRTAALEAEVGEREIAEAALRDSEQRFRNILDNVPIGVIYTNLAGDIIQANPRFCELTGYTENELLTLSVLDCTHPDDVAHDVAIGEQLVRGEIPMYRGNKRYITKGGDIVRVQTTVSLLRDSQNRPWRVVGVVEDITEHLRLEEAEHAREAAEASNRAKSEFLSRMSHELRTPLNAMLGFAQLLELDQRHPLTEAQRPWVVQIQQAGWHLLEMINDVLDLSRIESGNLRLQTEVLNLTELLDATVAMVASDARARGITISQDLGSGTAALMGDATRVKQILTNLLTNAVKYNAEKGRIHIASRTTGADTMEIAVTDTGLGMTQAQMADLFKPFNRLGRELSAVHEGTGIGLVISRRLAELMGGTLKVRSVAGQGSSFILSLPRAADPGTVPSYLDPRDAGAADYHRRRVHYIEDNETNVEVMRGILAQRSQVQMSVSITGLDGLAAVRAHRPDLVLLDMHLPDISGMDLLRHLKADQETANIPIVVVSANALTQQITEALEAGAERYLTKPVAVAELLAVMDDLLERVDTVFS